MKNKLKSSQVKPSVDLNKKDSEQVDSESAQLEVQKNMGTVDYDEEGIPKISQNNTIATFLKEIQNRINFKYSIKEILQSLLPCWSYKRVKL